MKQLIKGFSLIEVMVAMLVLSVGLLGLASTLIAALHSSTSNYLSQQATQSAYDIFDRMRSNLGQGQNPGATNPYITALVAPSASIPTVDCTVTACSDVQMATYDVWQWKTTLKNSLPAGLGQIAVVGIGPSAGTAQITVTIQWSDQPAQASFNPSGGTTRSYTVVSAL